MSNTRTSAQQGQAEIDLPGRQRGSAGKAPLNARLGDAGSDGTGVLDWGALVPRLVYETKVWIIEAMRWIDRPLSPRELEAIFDGAKSIAGFEYHLRNLVGAQCVQVVAQRRVRGACESRYFFTDAMKK